MAIAVAIVVGILILLFLVFIHEFGHFATAKFFGIKVEEFGFGFPPRAWGKKKGETIYSINWIPAGGFVRLLGEEEDSNNPRSFTKQSPWVRAVVVSAGVIINFLLAVLIFYFIVGLNSFQFEFDQTTVKTDFIFGKQQNSPVVLDVSEESPADKAGIKIGDKVISASGSMENSTTIETSSELQEFIQARIGEEIVFEVQNIEEDQSRWLELTPRVNPPEDEGAVGIGLGLDIATVSYESPAEKTLSGFMHAVNTLQIQIEGIGGLFKESVEEGSPTPLRKNVAGPIGIVDLISRWIGFGGIQAVGLLVGFTALISLILSVINILPIPALDGGRLYFILVEGITGRKVKPQTERVIHGIAFMVLILLVILVAINDVVNIIERVTGVALF